MKKNILIILFLSVFNICQAETKEYLKELAAFVYSQNFGCNCDFDFDMGSQRFPKRFDDSGETFLQLDENTNNENYKWYNLAQYKNKFLSFVLDKCGGIDSKKEDFPKLHKFVDDLCHKHKIEKPRIIVFPNNMVPNALTIQLFNQRDIIILYGGIMSLANDKELEAILAHEIGHIKHNHSHKKLLMKIGSFLASYKLINTCLKSEIFSNSLQNKKFIPIIASSTISWLLTTLLMRKYETQADEFSLVNGHAAGLKSLMSKLDIVKLLRDKCEEIENKIKNNLNPECHDQYKKDLIFLKIIKAFLSTLEFLGEHPSCQDRIKKAEEYLNYQNLQDETV